MDAAISAVAGELVSRFFSFMIARYCSSSETLEGKVQRLQHLLMRIHTVVEEADGRYITNSGMLVQLKVLSDAMYRGHHVLDNFKFRLSEESSNEVSDSFALVSRSPLKRPRTLTPSMNKGKAPCTEIHDAMDNLETVIASMTEFVTFLGGCERMSRKPYDTYLFIDNFMFGRHTEKQKLLNFLLQHNPPGAPAVLPIIGGLAVGKKTLVAHACGDERVRSHFSSILQMNGDSFLKFQDYEIHKSGVTLVVIEFFSDVDDKDWKKFYCFVSGMGKGSKVIIISELERLARFGSVAPICLNKLSYEELRYLFKILAFGSANPMEHPRLVPIAEGFAKRLQIGGSLVSANAVADVLRRNMNAQVWLCILNWCQRVIDKNISMYGEDPKQRIKQGNQVDLTDFSLHPASPIRFIPCTCSNRSTAHIPVKKELPKVTFGELLVNPSVTPTGEFHLVSWESRLPPYTSFIRFVPSCPPNMPVATRLSGRKRVAL